MSYWRAAWQQVRRACRGLIASSTVAGMERFRVGAISFLWLLLPLAHSLGNGGAWQVGVPLSGDGAASDQKRSTEVAIEEERLTIDLHQEFAAIEVRYRMHNTGPKVVQDFFFPVEQWSPEDPDDAAATGTPPPDLEGYRITADNTELKWKKIANPEKSKLSQTDSSGDFPAPKRLWKKSEIPFAANQAREILIRYRVAYSGDERSISDDGHESEKILAYALSPAATWKGPIAKGTIVINVVHPRPEEVAIERPNERFRNVSETRYEWSFANLEPTLADDLTIVAHRAFDSYSTGYSESEEERQIPRDYIVQGERYFLLHGDFEATASSTLRAAGGKNYEAKNIRSVEPDLTWAEGVEGDGLGESLTLKVNRPLPLDEIQIMPGYASGANPSLWLKNNRAAEVEITLNGKHTFIAQIPDEKFTRLYPIPVRGFDEPVTIVKLTIKAVHRGTGARDTCIASVRLKGKLASKPHYQPAR